MLFTHRICPRLWLERELAYWPDGPDHEPHRHRVRYNTAMVLDTDSVFHGVERVADVPANALPRIRPGMALHFDGGGIWTVRDGGDMVIARYEWPQLRFSISWKAYCFRDERERNHSDDLTPDRIVERLVDDMCARGVVRADVARDATLGQRFIDEYVCFPMSTARSTS